MSKNCIITTVKSKIKGNATSFIERETEIIIPVSKKFTLAQTRAMAQDKVNKINKEYLSEKFGDVVSLNTSYTDGTGINIHPSKRLVDAYEVKEGNKTLEEVNSGRDLNYFNGDVALYEQEQKDFENENNFKEEQKELDKIVTKINNESRQSESFQNIITNENKPTPIDTTKSDGLLWGEMSSYESETNFQPTKSKSQYRPDNSLQERINGRDFKEIWNSNEFTQLERENILLHSIQERMLDKTTFNGELFAGINSKLGKLELRVVDGLEAQITPQQKQQAQQLYSQYLEQNPNGSVEQFKSWVNNRNDLYYQVKNIFNAVKELEDKLKSLNKTANSIGSEKNIDDILKKAGLESDFRKEFLQLLKDNPSLKSLKLSEVISSYLKEFVKESDRQYYTAIEEPLSEELENVLIDYFDKFHIRRKQLDNLKEKFGVDSIGIFDVLAKTIYYSKNRNLLTLPEEYGHVFVELLGSISNKKADNPLFKYLFDNIESWDGYQRVYRDYKDKYTTAEGNIDIYKIKKEAIGQAIGIALVRNYKVQKGDKTFWAKIQETIDYILNLIKGIDYVSLNTTVDNIAKDILSKNYSKLDRLKKDTSNYNLLSYSETIKNQNKKDGGKALKFMQWFSQKGMIITGSLAYRLQGNVYRPEIDALHDIDNIVPSDVHKLNLNKSNFLNEEQLEKDKIYRNLITEGNYKEAKQYKIQGNLKLGLNDVLDQVEVLKDFKKEFPDTDFLYSFFNQKANAYYVTINAIWSENQELKDRFKSYSGSFNNRLANFTEEELSQLYLFDFFLRPETSTQYKQIEDKEYGLNLAHFNYSFYEKLNMMGRPKDAYDYQMWDYFNEDNILAPDFNDRLVYFQINQSQQKQNQIQEVFNEYPELSKIGTVEQYSQYLEQNPNGSVEQFKSWVDEFNMDNQKLNSNIQIFSDNKKGNFDSSSLKDDDLALMLFNQALGLNLTSVNQLTWDNIKDNIFFKKEDGSLGVRNLAFIGGNLLSTEKVSLNDFLNQKGLYPEYKVFIGESVIYPNVFESLQTEDDVIKKTVFENLFNLSGAFEQVKKELNNYSPETFVIETFKGRFTFPKRFASGFFKIASTVELLLKENQSSYIQDYLSSKRKKEETVKDGKKVKPIITQTLTVNDTIVQNAIGLIGNPIIENAIKNNTSVKIQVFSNTEYSEDGVAGWYITTENTIYLHESMLSPQHLSEGLPLIAHELLHSVTSQSLLYDEEFSKSIRALLKIVKNKSNIKDFYGFKNEHEFLSEAFSSQEFRQLLKNTKFEGIEELSIWQKFINAILKLFGKNVKYTEKSTLVTAEEILNDIINDNQHKIQYIKSNILDKFNTHKSLSDFISQKSQERLKAIQEVFNSNPELSKVGNVFSYAIYLDTIFPDSKVKDIVYHGSLNKIEELFNENQVKEFISNNNTQKTEDYFSNEINKIQKESKIIENSLKEYETSKKIDNRNTTKAIKNKEEKTKETNNKLLSLGFEFINENEYQFSTSSYITFKSKLNSLEGIDVSINTFKSPDYLIKIKIAPLKNNFDLQKQGELPFNPIELKLALKENDFIQDIADNTFEGLTEEQINILRDNLENGELNLNCKI